MKCLVTGGAGFIGSNLTDRLLAEGHQVAVIDDLSHGKRKNVNKEAEFHKADIRDEKIHSLMKRIRPQVIFHLAAQMEVRRSVDDPIFDADVNIMGFINLLQAAVTGGCPRLLFSSSGGAVYGEQGKFPADETHPTHPLSPYGISKLCGEHYAEYFGHMGVKCAALRLANVYGPRQDPNGEAGVIAIFIQKMLKGETPIINGTGKQTRDFVYVDNVVDAFLSLMEKDLTGPFNVGTGVETNVNRLYELLAAQTGHTAPPIHGPAKSGEQMRSSISAAKLKAATDWDPGTDIKTGLAATVNWFRSL